MLTVHLEPDNSVTLREDGPNGPVVLTIREGYYRPGGINESAMLAGLYLAAHYNTDRHVIHQGVDA